ncbi:MAG: hypothetical protein ABIF82_14740 [Planctomycetota bacterium]
MASRSAKSGCRHKRARFHSVQKLGGPPSVELWHCSMCNSTLAAQGVPKRPWTAAAT